MMKNIDQHHRIERLTGIGNRAAIKGFDGDSRIRTNQGVQARDRDIRPLLRDNKIQCSIAASYIQNARGPRNEGGYALRQCANSPAKDKFLMQHANSFRHVALILALLLCSSPAQSRCRVLLRK